MDLDALISEIYNRVQERVAACENGVQPSCPACCDEEKPVLGVLAEDHGMICHPTFESETLREMYTMRCALMEEKWDVENWEGVIAYTLTNEALGKIVNGIFDTPYTRAFGKALLMGKKIFIPEEEVELYRYKETAPAKFYQRLEENITFLKENGVVIVPNAQLVSEILGTECDRCVPSCSEESEEPVKEAKDLSFTRRVLSERDLIVANQDRITRILVTKKTIVTDLARDYAKKYHIVIELVNCL